MTDQILSKQDHGSSVDNDDTEKDLVSVILNSQENEIHSQNSELVDENIEIEKDEDDQTENYESQESEQIEEQEEGMEEEFEIENSQNNSFQQLVNEQNQSFGFSKMQQIVKIVKQSKNNIAQNSENQAIDQSIDLQSNDKQDQPLEVDLKTDKENLYLLNKMCKQLQNRNITYNTQILEEYKCKNDVKEIQNIKTENSMEYTINLQNDNTNQIIINEASQDNNYNSKNIPDQDEPQKLNAEPQKTNENDFWYLFSKAIKNELNFQYFNDQKEYQFLNNQEDIQMFQKNKDYEKGASFNRSELILNTDGENYLAKMRATEYNKQEKQKLRPILSSIELYKYDDKTLSFNIICQKYLNLNYLDLSVAPIALKQVIVSNNTLYHFQKIQKLNDEGQNTLTFQLIEYSHLDQNTQLYHSSQKQNCVIKPNEDYDIILPADIITTEQKEIEIDQQIMEQIAGKKEILYRDDSQQMYIIANNFDDFSIQFLYDLSKQSNETDLDTQYVLIQSSYKQFLYIYSLSDTSSPILQYTDQEFEFINQGFFLTNDSDSQVIFSLKSKNDHYELVYDPDVEVSFSSKQILQKKSDHQWKGRIFNEQIDIQQIDISNLDIKVNDVIQDKQYYLIAQSRDPELIHPLHTDDTVVQKVMDHIKSKVHFKENENGEDEDYGDYYDEEDDDYDDEYDSESSCQSIDNVYSNDLFVLYFSKSFQYFQQNEKTISFFKEIRSQPKENKETFYFMNNVIYILQNGYQLSEIITIKDTEWQKPFDLKLKEFNQDHKMLKMLMQNVKYNKNEESLYINSQKQQLFTSHNKAFLKNKIYEFDKNHLLINIGTSEPNFKLIKISSEEGVQLINYQISQQSCIFFFSHEGKLNDLDIKINFFIVIHRNQLEKKFILDKTLLDSKEMVYLPMQINNIKKKLFDKSNLAKYYKQQNVKMSFQKVQDQSDPTNNFVTFLAEQKIDAEQKEELFLCFLNIEQLSSKLSYQALEDKKNEINFQDFLQIFKVDFYKQDDEFILSNKSKDQIKNYTIKQKQFQRCSNWQSNLFETVIYPQKNSWFSNTQKSSQQYSSVFQFAMNIQFEQEEDKFYEIVEVKDILVTIDLNEKIIFNLDNHIQYKIKDESQQFNSQIQLLTSKIRYVAFSPEYMDQLRKINGEEANTEIQLFPNFDDFGNINLSYILIDNDTSKDESRNIDVFILLNNKDSPQNLNYLEGPMCQMKIRNLKFQQQIFVVQTCMNYESILNQLFSPRECLYWLYYYQNLLFSSSMTNFNEIFLAINKQQILSYYFQPKLLAKGKSFCSLNMDESSNTIDNVIKLITSEDQNDDDDNYFYLRNSVVHQTQFQEDDVMSSFPKVAESLGISKFFDLKYDQLNYQSILQFYIEKNKLKETTRLLEAIIKNQSQKYFAYLLSQDLPQLIYSQKYNINEFLMVNQDEETEKNQKKDSKQYFCKLELQFDDKDVPELGIDQKIVKAIQSFQGQNISKQDFLIKIKEKSNSNDLENVKIVPIKFSYILLEPLFNKVKFDKFVCRTSKQSLSTDYLQYADGSVRNYKSLGNFFLSKMIKVEQEDTQLLELDMIQEIIQFQFIQSKPYVQIFFYLYIFGFIVPFLFNFFSNNYESDAQEHNSAYTMFRYSLYFLAILTQILFFQFEIAEIYCNGLYDYFSNDGWNIFDFSQPFIFFTHLFIKIYYKQNIQYGTFKIFDNLIQILILVGLSSKILQLIRFNDEYGCFVQMFIKIIGQLIPFLLMFMASTFIFTLIIVIMEADVDDADYPDIVKFLRIIIQTFRISVGDIQVFNYGPWSDKENAGNDFYAAQTIAISIIWMSWFINMIVMLIIIVNLLIAVVGQIYEEVMSKKSILVLKQRHELNQMVFQILNFYGFTDNYMAILIQKPQGQSGASSGDFQTVSQRIKQNIDDQMISLKKFISENLVDKVEKNSQDIEGMNEKNQKDLQENFQNFEQKMIKNLESEIQSVKNEIIQIRKKNEEGIQNFKEEQNVMKDLLNQILQVSKNGNN